MTKAIISEQPLYGDFHTIVSLGKYGDGIELTGYPTGEPKRNVLYDKKKKKFVKIESAHRLEISRLAKKDEIHSERIEAERLFRLLKPLIDGGNAESIESALSDEVDAAKNAEELEAIKWG